LMDAREITPLQLLEQTLARLDALEPVLNAFTHVDRDGALAAARAATSRQASSARLSPLDGIPVSVKDNIFVAEMPARWGSLLFRDYVPDRDDICVERLRAAGAVIIGKTTTPEFALMGRTQSRLSGVTRNPWDPNLTPGGSSGGASGSVWGGVRGRSLGRIGRQACRHHDQADRNGNAHGSQTADKTRHQAVEPQLEEGCYTNRRRRAEYEKQFRGGRHVRLAQPQRHGQPKGEPEQEEVGGGEDGTLGIAAEADQAQKPLAHQCLERRPRLETGHASTTKANASRQRLARGAARFLLL